MRIESASVYTVRPGDTLDDIAQDHDTSVEELRRANPAVRGDLLLPNDVLRLPSPAPRSATGGLQPPSGGGVSATQPHAGPPVNRQAFTDAAFMQEVRALARDLNAQPEDLLAVMAFETGGTFDPAKRNRYGSGATGLIQFMPATARSLGTTTTHLARLSRAQQMHYVRQHLQAHLGGVAQPSLDDLYMAVLMPSAVGSSAGHGIIKRAREPYTYRSNRGLDANADGVVTKHEAAAKVRAYLPSVRAALER